jgi:asparagine synthase (glutamine-hydrolysing)
MNVLARQLAHEPPTPALDLSGVWTFSLDGYDPAPSSAPVSVRIAGAIDDRAALAERLGLPATVTPAALVAAAFDRWGAEMFGHLRGTFAIAIADAHAREVLVARDHAGCQPLFYARHDGRVSFAASARALVALPGVSRGFNRVAIADTLCRRHPDAGETLFEAVRRVPSAAFVRIAGGTLAIHEYWTPLGDENDKRYAFDRFLALQKQAVRRARDGQHSAIYLSGGLDSVSIAMVDADLARKSHQPSSLALSLALPDPECRERPLQESVARTLGVRQHVMEFDEALGRENLIAQALAFNAHLSAPVHALWTPAYVALARAGRALGATSIMTGIGGDEWLSASPYVVADLLARGQVVAAARFVRAWRRSENGRGLILHRGLRPLVGSWLAQLAPDAWSRRRTRRAVANDPAWIAPDETLRDVQRSRAHAALAAARPAAGFAAVEHVWNLRHAAALHEKEEYAELGRLVGVQFRHPYYDADLVEFLCRAPISVLNTGGWLKGLVRSQLGDRLPGLGFERQRKVLATGFHRSTLERAWREYGPRLIRVPLLAELGVVDPHGVARLAAQSDARAMSRLWDVLNVETWLRYQL